MSAICNIKDEDIILNIKVHPKSSKKCVIENEDFFDVYVNDPPEKGKANTEVIKLLSKHFGVPKSNVIIIKGETARIKKVMIRKKK